MFRAGQQIGGYTLISKLGRGGFGEVWLAEKRSQFVSKKVAIKLPLEEQVNLDAIRHEATLWEQASGHPNVLPIIDADIIDGQVVIVSEYADGGSLADRIKREGRLPLQKAVEMTIGILNGLEFLHGRKIIHRDIKPQNILLQGDTPRLADFGISRAMNTTVISSTIIGTDAYMSPESFDGKRNVQTDIWSIGVVLYALLADRLPFPQEHPSERMFAILTKEFAPLPPEVPQNLQRIVQKALAKESENRYQTTTEMRDELQKVLIGINHPTFAPTEAFQIPIENLPTIATLENQYETGEPEKETVVAPENFNVPAPTEPAVQPESIVTHFKQTPPPTHESAFSPPAETNEPPPVRLQMSGHHAPEAPAPPKGIWEDRQLRYLMAIAIGIVAVLVIGYAASIGKKKPTLSNTNNANNANTAGASSSNTATPASPFPMSVNVKTTQGAFVTLYNDGRIIYIDSGSPDEKSFTVSSSFRIEYYKGNRDYIELKINGNNVTLPPNTDGVKPAVAIEITKANYNQMLLRGLNANQLIVNANATGRSGGIGSGSGPGLANNANNANTTANNANNANNANAVATPRPKY
jgi:serine/threonine protein kinase